MEEGLLEGIRQKLLAPEVIDEFRQRVVKRLAATETELSRLQAAAVPREVAKVEPLLPRVVDGFRELIDDLPNALKRDPARARAGVRRILGGQIKVAASATEGRFMTEQGRVEAAFLRATGSDIRVKACVVAGAGFEPATFGL